MQWSQTYFTSLTPEKHETNNNWFELMLYFLKEDGCNIKDKADFRNLILFLILLLEITNYDAVDNAFSFLAFISL